MAPPRKDWKCRACGLDQTELQLERSLKAPHQALCRGKGADGLPLGFYDKCMDRSCKDHAKVFESLDALRKHYDRNHSIKLHEYAGLHHLRTKLQPDNVPTTDMNANFGAFYSQTTTTTTISSTTSTTSTTTPTTSHLSRYLQDLAILDITFPVQAAAKLPDLLSMYRTEFRYVYKILAECFSNPNTRLADP